MALYLVTGAAGFIGSSLCRSLLERGESVRGIDNFSTGKRGNIENIESRMDFREADLLDMHAMRAACAGVDYVLHQAALPSVPRSVADPQTSHESNLTGTLNLLVAAREAAVKRVVYASSSSVYGETPTLPKHEGMPPDPISPYAVQKIGCEFYMRSFYRIYGLETVCLRYFNVFGPFQDPNSQYSGVLVKFCLKMLSREAVQIYGDGKQSRDFTYIENTVSGNLLAVTAPAQGVAGRTFNIACGNQITLNHAAEVLQKITGFHGEIVHQAPRVGDIRHSFADISLAGRVLGYQPQVSFEEGLTRTANWYRQLVDRQPA